MLLHAPFRALEDASGDSDAWTNAVSAFEYLPSRRELRKEQAVVRDCGNATAETCDDDSRNAGHQDFPTLSTSTITPSRRTQIDAGTPLR
jgi:hypothetical protein